jgi:hypothetical protein
VHLNKKSVKSFWEACATPYWVYRYAADIEHLLTEVNVGVFSEQQADARPCFATYFAQLQTNSFSAERTNANIDEVIVFFLACAGCIRHAQLS